jgi:hypothetical protein
MTRTAAVRVTKELAEWLDEASARTGLSGSRIIRKQLEKARAAGGDRPFMRLAGAIGGATDLSSRKGLSR